MIIVEIDNKIVIEVTEFYKGDVSICNLKPHPSIILNNGTMTRFVEYSSCEERDEQFNSMVRQLSENKDTIIHLSGCQDPGFTSYKSTAVNNKK